MIQVGMLQYTSSTWISAQCFYPIPIATPHDFSVSADIASDALGSQSQPITLSKQHKASPALRILFSTFFRGIALSLNASPCSLLRAILLLNALLFLSLYIASCFQHATTARASYPRPRGEPLSSEYKWKKD